MELILDLPLPYCSRPEMWLPLGLHQTQGHQVSIESAESSISHAASTYLTLIDPTQWYQQEMVPGPPGRPW